MSKMPDVVTGETVDPDVWGNPIRSRAVQRYDNALDLSDTNPTPEQGEVAYMLDTDELLIYDGSVWGSAGLLQLSGGTMTGDITFPSGVVATTRAGRLSLQNVVDGALLAEFDPDEPAVLFNDGTSSRPSMSFQSLASHGFYKNNGATGRVAYVSLGTDRLWIDSSGTWLRTAGSTGDAANISADGSNLLRKSTSARKYKTNIEDAAHLADLTLQPVTFHRDDDNKDFIGFIADDIPDDRAIEFGDDGEVENYDVRAVVAILAAKINRLEAQINVS